MSAPFFTRPDDQLMVWAANVLLQVTIITAVALTVAAIMRRQPAVRHAVLAAALMLMLICPFIALAVQSSGGSFLSVTVTPPAVSSETAAPPADAVVIPSPQDRPSVKKPPKQSWRMALAGPSQTVDQTEAAPFSQEEQTEPAAMASTIPATAETAAPNADDSTAAKVPQAAVAAPSAAAATNLSPANPSRPSLLRSIMDSLLAIWVCGVLFYLARLAWGWWRLRVVLHSAVANTNEQLNAVFQQIVQDLSVRRVPELLKSRQIAGPVATGVFRPVILIPEGLVTKITPGELRNVLIHETAHIVRRDQVVVWLQNLAAAVFWMHPLAVAVNQRLARAREEICDNYVLATTDRCSYGRTLLSLASLMHASRPLPGTVGFFASRWKLERRVAELLDERRNCRIGLTARGTALVGALSVAIAVVAACGTITLADGPAPTADEPAASTPGLATTSTAAKATGENVAASSVPSDAEWKPGNPETALPGLIPAPAEIPGLGRWQAMMLPVGGYVEAAVFSPDGKTIAFGEGTYVRIHDAESLELQRVLVGHSGNIRAVNWSPDGKWIATGADDATVRIWSNEGVPGAVMKDHLAPVRSIAWSPDSQSFASAALDGTIRVWNLEGTAKTVIEGHEAPVNTIAWSPDGKVLAAGDENRMIRFWSPDGQAGPVLSGHHGAITRVRWSPDGNWLASTSEGLIPTEPGQQAVATVRLWKADGTAARTLRGHSRSIHAVAWSPDSRQLVTAAEDRQTILWDVDGNGSRRIEQTLHDYGDVFTLDWNAATGRILAGGRFSVRFFNTEGPVGSTDLVRPNGTKLMFADWHPKENKLAIGAEDASLHIWSDGFKKERTIDGFTFAVGCAKWSPDGQKLAVNDSSQTVRILTPEGELIEEFTGNNGTPRTMAWSPDGKLLVVPRRARTVDIFNAEGEVHSPNLHPGGGTGASFSPDGTKLATSGLDANARISEIDSTGTTTKEVALLQGFDGDVDSIDWSPDGQWIATGHNSSLRFWHPDGTPGTVVPGFEASIMRLDWSPDSKTIVTGCWDTSVLLWNTEGMILREFPNHAAPCWGVTFSPDGTKLATCGWDGVARILDVETGEVLEMAIYVAGFEPPAEGSRIHPQKAIAFNRAGQVTSGEMDVLEQRVVYLVEQPSGACEVLKPSEFIAKAAGAVLPPSP